MLRNMIITVAHKIYLDRYFFIEMKIPSNKVLMQPIIVIQFRMKEIASCCLYLTPTIRSSTFAMTLTSGDAVSIYGAPDKGHRYLTDFSNSVSV